MARVVLVRHGHPRQEGEDHAHWALSSEGRAAAALLSKDPIWKGVGLLLTSPERKAEETARVIAEALGTPVEIREDLREVRRPWEAEGYEDKIRAFLKGRAPKGWETREAAEARLQRVVSKITGAKADIGVVSHALLLTLFLARASSSEPAFWLQHSIGFAEFAVYESDADVLLQGFRRPTPRT
ncbi:MAG: histidine phosphatase family protein [Thermoplasmata archaeon]